MIRPPTDALALAILLHDVVEDRQIVERSVLGRLPDDYEFQPFVLALEAAELLTAEDENARTLEFRLPHTATGKFYLSMAELLSSAARRVAPPARFFVADLNFLYEGQPELPEQLKSYFNASVLFQLLQSVADHYNSSDNTLVFWEKGKIVLTSEYLNEELRPLNKLSDLRAEFFESKIHSRQKCTIVRMALLEEFSGHSAVRLGELLERFEFFFDRVVSSYQLYVAEFSFEKIKAEIEKEKLEFTTKLNKVFSDIQNQLLAIPAAVLLVGGQMENSSSWTLKNSLIWAGTLFFCILMNLLIRNQRNTLLAIHHEIDQQWQQIRGRHSSVADRFSTSYQQLQQRYWHQESLIRVISTMVAFSLALASALFVYYSATESAIIFAAWIAGITLFVGLGLLGFRWWADRAQRQGLWSNGI